MKLTARQIDDFLKNPNADLRVFLIYGPDYGLGQERLSHLRQFFQKEGDDLSISQFTEAHLRDSPHQLHEEMIAPSLFGGARLVIIRGGDKEATKQIIALITHHQDAIKQSPNRLFITMGELSPRHELRKLCETHDLTVAIPCYLDEVAGKNRLISEILNKDHITIEAGAKQFLMDHIGLDHGLSRSEIEKLALYAGKGGNLTLNDVQKSLGDSANFPLIDLLNASFEGQKSKIDRAFHELIGEGVNSIAMLRNLQNHLLKLIEIHHHKANGHSFKDAVNKLTPKPFFKLADHLERQALLWPQHMLVALIDKALTHEQDMKQSQYPDHLVMLRFLLQICYQAERYKKR